MSETGLRYSRGGGVGVSVESITTGSLEYRISGIAALLAPPAEPRYDSPWTGLAIGTLLLLVIVGLAGIGGGIDDLNKLGRGDETVSAATEYTTIAIGLVAFAGMVLFIRARRNLGSSRRAELDNARMLWEMVYDLWDRTYYCHKDDAVFVPGHPALITVAQFSALMKGLDLSPWDTRPAQPSLPPSRLRTTHVGSRTITQVLCARCGKPLSPAWRDKGG